MAQPARGHPRRRLCRRALPRLVEPARHAPPCCRARSRAERLCRARAPLGGGALFRLARALGGLLRDRAGRLDVSAARVAFAAYLSVLKPCSTPCKSTPPQVEVTKQVLERFLRPRWNSTTCSAFAAIVYPQTNTEPPGPGPSRPGPRSPASPEGHSPQCTLHDPQAPA